MQNYSTVLDQTTWGIHLNFEGHIAFPPNYPSWLTQLQQQDWQRRGIVVWDAGVRVVAHLYAGYALEPLEQMRTNDVWQSNGFLIGSPTYQLSSETVDGISSSIQGAACEITQMDEGTGHEPSFATQPAGFVLMGYFQFSKTLSITSFTSARADERSMPCAKNSCNLFRWGGYGQSPPAKI